MTDVSAYFAQIYADSSDPWQYEKRWYEVRKRAICLSLLPYPHFAKAIELGCSNGVFSEQLAQRCDYLRCVDGQLEAVKLASERLQNQAHVQVVQGLIPQDLPSERFDLIVVSEILYYLAPDALTEVIAWLNTALTDNGVILACHWRYRIDGFQLTGETVHDSLQQQLHYRQQSHVIDQDFLLTIWQANHQSLAKQENLVE